MHFKLLKFLKVVGTIDVIWLLNRFTWKLDERIEHVDLKVVGAIHVSWLSDKSMLFKLVKPPNIFGSINEIWLLDKSIVCKLVRPLKIVGSMTAIFFLENAFNLTIWLLIYHFILKHFTS